MKIKTLPPDTHMKIAAGEVVSNAATVVKELIENALDASADLLKIQIAGGGKDEIIVWDNGSGMEEEDLLQSIKPHSTSKIQHWEDILDIHSFGFRGEALASIAAVSELRITSRTPGQPLGVCLEILGGNLQPLRKVDTPIGTKVEVHNLFFNVPARRKFLKSSSIESRMVIELIERFMLSNPSIAFHVIKDRQEIYKTIPGTIKERLIHIFPMVPPESLRRIEHSSGDLSCKGYITSPDLNRPNRTGIITFVNNRVIRHPMLFSAIENGYGATLPKGRFPFAVLMIQAPPAFVDVNVHPQKSEVKFAKNEPVFSLVAKAVEKALGERPQSIRLTQPEPSLSTPLSQQAHEKPSAPYRQISSSGQDRLSEPAPFFGQPRTTRVFPPGDEEPVSQGSRIPLSIFKGRYILCEHPLGLSLIDQHAAHESMIYRKLTLTEERLESQALLIPITIQMDTTGIEALEQRKKEASRLGFRWTLQEETQLSITAAPSILPIAQIQNVWVELIDEFRLWDIEGKTKALNHIYHSLACHGAIRTGDSITLEDAHYLIKEIESAKLFSCPHGRPIEYIIRFEDLDRFFRR